MAVIKWRRVDEVKVRNIVRRFNIKIATVSRLHPNLAPYQPDRVNANAMIENLQKVSRQEFNRQIARLERYLRKGAEKAYMTRAGVITTEWQRREVANTLRSINARNRAIIKRYDLTVGGGRSEIARYENLRARPNNFEWIQPEVFKKYVENLERQASGVDLERKNLIYKENFMKAIENELGANSPLYGMVEQTEPTKLADILFSDEIFNLQFVYDPYERQQIENMMIERFLELAQEQRV